MTFDGKALGLEIVDVVKGYVSKLFDGLEARVKALEEREPIAGEKGDPGLDGKDGAAGRDGVDGLPGKDGRDGEKGEKGDPGQDGKQGERGEKGLDGRDGLPGRDGLMGHQGEKGLDGKDGINGRDGVDGKDGFSLDDFDAKSEDDGRTIILSFHREGREPIIRTIKTGVVLDRGVWKEGGFEKGDSVTWAGSSWIAQRDTDAKPDTPDSGWRLAVKRGRDGKEGKRGPQGERGLKGDPGTPGRNYV